MDETGVSVDRDGEREETVIINSLKQRFERRYIGSVKIRADICLDNEMTVIPEPENNEFHAAIYNDCDKTPLEPLKALILSDNAEIIKE